MPKKEIAERAAKTFIEAFVSTLLTGLAANAAGGINLTTLQKIAAPVAISALAAGLSAVWNGFGSGVRNQGSVNSR